MAKQKRSRVLIVSRHPASIDWIKRQGYQEAEVVHHLDPATVQRGDLVIGTLPVHLARIINEQGVRFIYFSVDVPQDMRGREISAEALETMNPGLEEMQVSSCDQQPVLIKNNDSLLDKLESFFRSHDRHAMIFSLGCLLFALFLYLGEWAANTTVNLPFISAVDIYGNPKTVAVLLDQAGIVFGCITVAFAAPALLSIYFRFKRSIKQPVKGSEVNTDQLASKYKAGMVLATQESNKLPYWLLNRLALQSARPSMAVLYTNKTRESAIKMTETFRKDINFYLKPCDDDSDRLLQPLNYQGNRAVAQRIIDRFLEHAQVKPEETFIDITGGTVVMSVSMMEAARERGIHVLYSGSKDKVTEKNYLRRDAAFTIDLTYES